MSVEREWAWAPRRVVTLGGILITAFLGLAAWALQGPPSPPPRASPRPGPTRASAAPTSPAPSPSVRAAPPAPPAPRGGAVDEPIELPRLLAQRFQFTRKDGSAGFVQLASALGSERVVTVINVWAPYCEPCRREFPALRELQEGWGSEVRFLPIQLEGGDPGPLTALMPEAAHHLIDYVPGGAVQGALAELGVIRDRATIPITLVLDCRHQLRWVKAGELTEIAALDRAVADLRGELGTPACSPPPSPVLEPGCGDRICNEHAGEDCSNCRRDCGCKRHQLCATRGAVPTPGLGHVCMDELE